MTGIFVAAGLILFANVLGWVAADIVSRIHRDNIDRSYRYQAWAYAAMIGALCVVIW